MTPDSFHVSVNSEGFVQLNCPIQDCDWNSWWEIYPSLWFLTRTARDHVIEVHDE